MDFKAEAITHIGGIAITNTFFTTICVSIFLVTCAYIYSKKIALEPTGYTNVVETLIEFLYNTAKDIVPSDKKLKEFFPLAASFFIFILVGNIFGLTPFFHGIGFNVGEKDFIPLFRPMNSDLNLTLGLALISVVSMQYFAIKYLGVPGHLKHYFSFNPIMLFVGLLELVSEFTKVISLSFRLFGNIYAGDIVIVNFSNIFALFLPLPFMGLEVIVSFVQAAVFAMLTLAFTNILTTHQEH